MGVGVCEGFVSKRGVSGCMRVAERVCQRVYPWVGERECQMVCQRVLGWFHALTLCTYRSKGGNARER